MNTLNRTFHQNLHQTHSHLRKHTIVFRHRQHPYTQTANNSKHRSKYCYRQHTNNSHHIPRFESQNPFQGPPRWEEPSFTLFLAIPLTHYMQTEGSTCRHIRNTPVTVDTNIYNSLNSSLLANPHEHTYAQHLQVGKLSTP